MAEAYNNTVTTLPEITEDFFAFLVVPPVTYFRNLQTKARGVLREDSFLRVTSTQEEAESVRTYLKDNYGVDTQVVPLSVNFTGDSNVTLSLKRLVDVEAVDREPDVGDLIQYTGNRILINGVDSPRYTFGRIDTQYVEEHPSNLYYTNSKVSSHIAATSLDTLTPAEGDNSTKVATTQYTDRAIASLIDSAPSTLDTLNELAAAINDDADFHATVLNANAALQTELDTTQAGAGLTGTGLYEEDSNTTYLQSASSLKNADSLLDTALFSIAQDLDRTQASIGLHTDGTFSTFLGTNYIDTATTMKDADVKLDTQAKVNADAIATETTNRQNADSALQDELDDTQSGAGLSVSGQYSANNSSIHLTAATSLKDADNKLDAALVQETSDRESADTTLQSNIDSEASTRASADTALGTRIDNLHAVASSGSYNDLINKPSLFSGSYNDLSNKPSLFSGSYNDLSNKPSLFSGSYNDLTDVPAGTDLTGYATETYVNTAVSNLVDSAPAALNTLNELAAAINDDANAYTTLNNAISLKANASDIFSGDYNDLSNKPSIPSAYSLPTASSSTKGGITTNYATNGKNYAVQMSGTNAYVNVPWVSSTGGGGFSGDYNDLDNKPTIPSLTGYATETYVDNAVFSGDYNDLDNKPTIPSAYTLPPADSQNLGGVKVSFSSGNLYISTT
tara:strand:- start:1130 stop:3172 length:2043 start_codon:yes stop_codon:yes gene_type:complete